LDVSVKLNKWLVCDWWFKRRGDAEGVKRVRAETGRCAQKRVLAVHAPDQAGNS